ncbi:hypothetical protein Peur_052252 [Populus x canadensis]
MAAFTPLKFSLIFVLLVIASNAFSIKEASIDDLQLAFKQNKLTSRKLVKFYIKEVDRLNPVLKGVIEVNPDALLQAKQADYVRRIKAPGSSVGLHGIPILLKDLIATKDKMNNTAGSFALLGSVVPRDAGVVMKLRKAGAIIFGKASMTEWAAFRSLTLPNGFSPRADPCGSSSGSAISVAANMVAVSLGTETDGSILCPSSANSVVGIKPTVGLTSRAGVITISPRQDTIGPLCRTVSDAVHVLDAIVGVDSNDNETKAASKYIPCGGYKQYLKTNGVKGKRLGMVRNPFLSFVSEPESQAFENHLQTPRRQEGAVLLDNLEIANISTILNFAASGEATALLAEFKISLNAYLKELVSSQEYLSEYGQGIFLGAQATDGIGNAENSALSNLAELTRNGFQKLMKDNKLDALVTPGSSVSPVLAIGGFPGINVPSGYDNMGVPFGINFGGLKGTEPKLIHIASGFEQATKIRKPPTFKSKEINNI